MRQWIQKVNRYFTFNPIEEGKFFFASLHLHGRVEASFQPHSDAFSTASWEKFLEALHLCFSEEAFENISLVSSINYFSYPWLRTIKARFEEL